MITDNKFIQNIRIKRVVVEKGISIRDKNNYCYDRLILLVELPIIIFFSSLAVTYMFFRLFGFFELPFDLWAKLTVCFTGLCLVLSVVFFIKNYPRYPIIGSLKKEVIYVFILAILGAILAMIINRPDVDDSAYVPRAVYYVEHPSEIFNTNVSWIATNGEKLITPFFTWSFYELFQAAFTLIFGGHFLLYHHIIFPAFSGALIVMSMFLLVSVFVSLRESVFFGCVVLIILALGLGETSFTYGNSSFVQAFQAKYVFLTVGVTSWCYFSLRYFMNPSLRKWQMLMLLALGITTLTSTAFPLLPVLTLTLVCSYIANELFYKSEDFKELMIIGVSYVLSLLPTIFLALEYREHAKKYFGVSSVIQPGFSNDFAGQINLIIHSNAPFSVSLLIFLFSVVTAFILSKFRIFIAVWVLFLIVFFLNPVVSDCVMKYLTTQAIYWRLFFLLPFPLITILTASLCFPLLKLRRRLLILLILFGVMFSVFWPQTVVRKINHVTVGVPREKIDNNLYYVTKEILNKVPEGVMLAPIEISNTVLLLSSNFPQLSMLPTSMSALFVGNNKIHEYNVLSDVLSYLASEKVGDDSKYVFSSVFGKFESPKSIIFPVVGENNEEISFILNKNGYMEEKLHYAEQYRLFVRKSGL